MNGLLIHRHTKSIPNKPQPIKLEFTPDEELAEIDKLGSLKGSRHYAVESSWIASWKDHLTGGLPPGRMRTTALLENGKFRKDIAYGNEYRVLNLQQWMFLYSKYDSETPIELVNPFSNIALQTSCSVPHYLSSPVTERMDLERISQVTTKATQSLIAPWEFQSETNSIDSKLQVSQKKKLFYIKLSQNHAYAGGLLNALFSIPQIISLFMKSTTGNLCLLLKGFAMNIVYKNYLILQSEKLTNFIENEVTETYGLDFCKILLSRLDSESSIFNDLAIVSFNYLIICSNCGEMRSKSLKKYFWRLDVYNSLDLSIKSFSDDIRIERRCKICKERLVKRLKVVSTSNLLIFTFNRFREEPYFYKISNFMKFNKLIRVCGNEYTLFGVIVHRGSLESGTFSSYCKRGKGWYECNNEGVYSATLKESLQQSAIQLVYYKIN